MVFNVVAYSQALTRLVERAEITKDTAATYLSCVRLLADLVRDGGEKEIGSALRERVKDLRQLRKYINAIKKYQEIILKKPYSLMGETFEKKLIQEYGSKTPKKQDKGEIVESSTKRKINGIHDLKTRLTFRLQLKSGLRVSEVAKFRVKDLSFQDGEIKIKVVEGKGRKSRQVTVLNDPYLYEKLQEYVKDKEKEERLFDSRRYIRKRAQLRDLETHDLRRLNARIRVKEELEKGKSFKEARAEAGKQLGHSFLSTTDIYLDGRRKNE